MVETPPVADESRSAKDPVASLAAHIAKADTGVQARLRRFHPLHDGGSALFDTERLLIAAQIQPRSELERQRWALLIHCLAIARGAHHAGHEHAPGRVLAEMRFSQARLSQIVEADAAVLADLLPRVARRLAAAGRALNWGPLAELLLYTDTPLEERAALARRQLVEGFLDVEIRNKLEAA